MRAPYLPPEQKFAAACALLVVGSALTLRWLHRQLDAATTWPAVAR